VSCQLGVLQRCFPSSIRRILDELPKSLYETYERILREILEHNQEHAHRLLQCLVAAVRPLKVEELAEFLAFDFDAEGIPKLNVDWRWEDQEEVIMSVCSNLITIAKDQDSRIVQFSHSSVKEFLTAERLAEPFRDVSRYYIRPETAHTVLIRACLGVLLRLDDDVNQDNIKNFPLAHYSAQYWTTHARFQVESSHIRDGMECLFDADKPHFATWLWIYNVDRWGRSMLTIRPEKPEAVPLYYAALLGFCDLVEHLIAEHPEHASAKGGTLVTPIHAAASSGQTDVLALLIQHGADVNGRGMYGDTPLFVASKNSRLEAGQFLLDHGAVIDAPNRVDTTALIYAIIWGSIEFVRMLLERGAAINARCTEDTTPLHWAASGGRIEVVRLLLEHGADVNARTKYGNVPSPNMVRNGSREIVELLSEYRAKSIKKSYLLLTL
jgi:ankyrin repeat protein